MNTHIIISITDLEALIKELEKKYEDIDPDDKYNLINTGEIAAYEKILTHYKKVDLSEEGVESRLFKNEAYRRSYDPGIFGKGYTEAIKDILP